MISLKNEENSMVTRIVNTSATLAVEFGWLRINELGGPNSIVALKIRKVRDGLTSLNFVIRPRGIYINAPLSEVELIAPFSERKGELNRILLLTGFGHINIEKNGYYEKPF
jgi:hypothetical protein